jgi:putative transcriptional regulator
MFGFERFTSKAINAVKFAHNQATRSLKSQVDPEDLLLGLLADLTTTSARLLRSRCAVDIGKNYPTRNIVKLFII